MEEYIEQESCIKEEGLFHPIQKYVKKGLSSAYQEVISRKEFVQCYVKWVLMPTVKSRMRLEGSVFFNTTYEEVEQKIIDGILNQDIDKNILEIIK